MEIVIEIPTYLDCEVNSEFSRQILKFQKNFNQGCTIDELREASIFYDSVLKQIYLHIEKERLSGGPARDIISKKYHLSQNVEENFFQSKICFEKTEFSAERNQCDKILKCRLCQN